MNIGYRLRVLRFQQVSQMSSVQGGAAAAAGSADVAAGSDDDDGAEAVTYWDMFGSDSSSDSEFESMQEARQAYCREGAEDDVEELSPHKSTRFDAMVSPRTATNKHLPMSWVNHGAEEVGLEHEILDLRQEPHGALSSDYNSYNLIVEGVASNISDGSARDGLNSVDPAEQVAALFHRSSASTTLPPPVKVPKLSGEGRDWG